MSFCPHIRKTGQSHRGYINQSLRCTELFAGPPCRTIAQAPIPELPQAVRKAMWHSHGNGHDVVCAPFSARSTISANGFRMA